jgi:hypothetical protein
MKSYSRNPKLTTTRNLITAKPCQFFSKKEGLLFLLIDHTARPIGRGVSNQRELLASPDSPSPRALLATLFFLVGRAGEAQRQSRHNTDGAKLG